MKTFHYRLTVCAVILLLVVFVPNQAVATSGKISKAGFGWHYNYDKQGRIVSIADPAKKRTNIRYTKQ